MLKIKNAIFERIMFDGVKDFLARYHHFLVTEAEGELDKGVQTKANTLRHVRSRT